MTSYSVNFEVFIQVIYWIVYDFYLQPLQAHSVRYDLISCGLYKWPLKSSLFTSWAMFNTNKIIIKIRLLIKGHDSKDCWNVRYVSV